MAYSGPCRFACAKCGKNFGRKGDLNRHARIHDPDAGKFRCAFTDCDYSALQKSNVITHYISRHTGLRPHRCHFQGCTKSYADGSALIRHEKRKHGYYRRSHKEYSKEKHCSGATQPRTLGIHMSSASSLEIQHESNLGGVPSSPPSLVCSSDVTKPFTPSVSPITPNTFSMPDLGSTSYDWYPFEPQPLSMDGLFDGQGPQSPLTSGFLDQGSSLWPEATPQSYFSQLWSSVPLPPLDTPAWFPPDFL